MEGPLSTSPTPSSFYFFPRLVATVQVVSDGMDGNGVEWSGTRQFHLMRVLDQTRHYKCGFSCELKKIILKSCVKSANLKKTKSVLNAHI